MHIHSSQYNYILHGVHGVLFNHDARRLFCQLCMDIIHVFYMELSIYIMSNVLKAILDYSIEWPFVFIVMEKRLLSCHVSIDLCICKPVVS